MSLSHLYFVSNNNIKRLDFNCYKVILINRWQHKKNYGDFYSVNVRKKVILEVKGILFILNELRTKSREIYFWWKRLNIFSWYCTIVYQTASQRKKNIFLNSESKTSHFQDSLSVLLILLCACLKNYFFMVR